MYTPPVNNILYIIYLNIYLNIYSNIFKSKFMLFNSLIYLLFSNSVTLRRDLSIFFNRIAILALQYSIVLHIISLFMCNKGISLHGSLLHISNITQIFQIFIFFYHSRSDFNFIIDEFSPLKVLIQPPCLCSAPWEPLPEKSIMELEEKRGTRILSRGIACGEN